MRRKGDTITDKTSYKKRLLDTKGNWISLKKMAVNRNQVEKQLSNRTV